MLIEAYRVKSHPVPLAIDHVPPPKPVLIGTVQFMGGVDAGRTNQNNSPRECSSNIGKNLIISSVDPCAGVASGRTCNEESGGSRNSPPRLYAPEPLEGFISRTTYAALTHLS
jgi:hypothetical protein